ncbi:MAG: putative CRISPR-associated protein [Nitrososphaerota archaeon]
MSLELLLMLMNLIEVLDKVSFIVESAKKRNCRVYVNATPGFKAETAFVMLISLLLGVNGVVYIHDSFDQLVLIPSTDFTRNWGVEETSRPIRGGKLDPCKRFPLVSTLR